MNVRKTDVFLADIGREYEWYGLNAGWNVADRYLAAVEVTCRLLADHPHLGPRGGFAHPRLREWRFFLVSRPFSKHILFYEASADELVLRPAMHGHRDLPGRLLELPGAA